MTIQSRGKQIESNNRVSAFRLTLTWSVVLFAVFILIGFLFRWISPTELHLTPSQFEEMAFVTDRAEVWYNTSLDNPSAGMFEPGSILYVIEMDDKWAMVRPLRVSRLDSVWIKTTELSLFEEEIYKEWARQYERDVVREMQEQ
jgi:hypothetical protein